MQFLRDVVSRGAHVTPVRSVTQRGPVPLPMVFAEGGVRQRSGAFKGGRGSRKTECIRRGTAMRTPRQAALLWSGGKDSALAIHFARRSHPDIHIARLVTCVSRAFDRVSMHGVRRQLVQDQADALGLPLD